MALVHPTALVDPGATLGADVSVGPYAVIESDVVIGERCSIGAHAVVKRHTRLGPDNRLFEHVVIGGEPQDFKFRDCVSRVEIGAGNILREGVTISRGSKEGGVTRLGDHCMLMANAHIGHDCVVGSHVVMANGAPLAGHVTVGDRVFISGNAAIHQFCRVGRLCMVAGLAKVVQDCLPFMIVDGVPGRVRGLNLVGLRRAGFSAEEVQSLRRAYRVLLASGTPLQQALDELSGWGSAPVTELVEFVRGSTRGFAHAR